MDYNRLKELSQNIDKINRKIGRIISWAALYMVLVQFAVVVLRYVFSISFIATVETVIYAHGLLFMLGAGYTVLIDGHVRVDVFYRDAKPHIKAWVDLLGALFFMLPMMILILWFSSSWIFHSWQVLEGSGEAGGLPILFLFKTLVWAFALLVGAQALSMAAHAFAVLKDKERLADEPEQGGGL